MGPRAAHSGGPGMSAARAAVLDQLTADGAPHPVADLASASGQHPNTVREHLEALVESGLVTRGPGTPAGRGRPAHRYQALPAEQTQPVVRQYAGLASALAAQIARSSEAPVADALAAGDAWGRALAAAVPAASDADGADTGGADTEGAATAPGAALRARSRVIGIMEGLGFAPDADAGAEVVRLRRCPLLETARRHPEIVCNVHLGLARGALEAFGGEVGRTGLAPFAEPGACLLHLPTNAASVRTDAAVRTQP